MKDVELGLAHTSNAERSIEGLTAGLRRIDRAQDLSNRCHFGASSFLSAGVRCGLRTPRMRSLRYPGEGQAVGLRNELTSHRILHLYGVVSECAHNLNVRDSIAPVIGLILSPFVVRALRGMARAPVPASSGTAGALAGPAGRTLRQRDAATASGGGRLVELPWAPSLGLSLSFNLDGLGLLFAIADHRRRRAHRSVRQPLPRRPRPGEPLLRLAIRVHGRDARRGPQRQHPHAVRVLGAHRLYLVPAHRLRARAGRRPTQPRYRR